MLPNKDIMIGLKGSDNLKVIHLVVSILITVSVIIATLCGCKLRSPDLDDTTREEIPGITYAGDETKPEKETDTEQNKEISPSSAIEDKTETGPDETKAEYSNSSNRLFVVSEKPDTNLVQTVNLAADLFCSAGKPSKGRMAVVYGDKKQIKDGDIVIEETSGLKEEEYRIDIKKENTYILYSPGKNAAFYNGKSYNNVLYGLQALLKMYISSGRSELAVQTVTDGPDTAERTLMIDCARKYWTVKWLKNLISEMSWMQYNTIELHMTEEQGIRFNIWKNSAGETVKDCNGNNFSFICGGTVVSWNSNYAENTSVFYNRNEITEIVEFARSRHIEVIPSVDLPGHSYNLITRCNNLINNGGLTFTYKGTQYSSKGLSGIHAQGSSKQAIDISNEFARNLSFAVTEAYAEFFRNLGCTKFNIGADEVSVNDQNWVKYAKDNKGSTQFDAFIIYINQLCSLLKEKGYRVRAFNDYLFSNTSNVALDRDLEICFWNSAGGKSPAQVAGTGRTVYNCIVNYCYYALRNNSSHGDARDKNCSQWTFHHSTAERIYSGCGGKCGYSACKEPGGWNPSKMWEYSSSSKTPITGSQLGGGYFLIWGDWAKWDSENNMWSRNDDYNLVNRMWANSVKMWDWNADKTTSYSEFKSYTDGIKYFPGY